MENPTVSGLRSRSRSKTPLLRSSCDRETCPLGDDHVHHKSGRRTPSRRSTSTPIKQLSAGKPAMEPVSESDEGPPPAPRTRHSARLQQLAKTSDYSSEENLDHDAAVARKYVESSSRSERVTTSTAHAHSLGEFAFSPINNTRNVSNERSWSGCSTDSTFVEQTLADVSVLLDRDPSTDHLPYKLYKMAGEYWNKYPKTDYTYSRLSKDRVELAPGQVALPNMSRRSLEDFRRVGPLTSEDELMHYRLTASASLKKRVTEYNSESDDEGYVRSPVRAVQRGLLWRLLQLLVTVVTTTVTTVTTTVTSAGTSVITAPAALYRKLRPPTTPYYYYGKQQQPSFSSRVSSAAAAPFIWMYAIITSTVTTITETITTSLESTRAAAADGTRRRWWPWLLLLPLLLLGCYSYWDEIKPREERFTYVPTGADDTDILRRLAALERWAANQDVHHQRFEDTLAQLNGKMSAHHYEQYLRDNFMRIMSSNVDMVALLLRDHFGREKMETIIKEQLAVLAHTLEREKETVHTRVEVRQEAGLDEEAVKRIVVAMLAVYDADRTGLVDYAMEPAGGQVISTRCTELYQIKTKQYFVLGLPVWWGYTSPRNALTPTNAPGDCWAFQGFPGYLVIRLSAAIEVTSFSVEHLSRLLAVDGKIESAPKNFSVYGLHGEMDPSPHLFGEYMYSAEGEPIQRFPVQHPRTERIGSAHYPVAYDTVELRVHSNHGNPTYTCLYRFRVHGNRLRDVRQAAADSLPDADTDTEYTPT